MAEEITEEKIMCRMKSAIILKDRIFIPDYDSHTEMLEELGIEDSRANAERLFVRAELIPPNNDVFRSIDTWNFNVDQDILPDWFVEEVDKERMVEAVSDWAKDRIHIGVDGLKIDIGRNHYIKDCKGVIIFGSASISKVCGSASISKVCDSAMIASSPYGWKNGGKVILSNNATFKDNKAKIIYQSGGWELRLVGKDAK